MKTILIAIATAGLTKQFVEFTLSEVGQKIANQVGFVSAK